MVHNVNVNVNVDSCFTLSCELVGILPNLKRWKLSTAHITGRWRGGRWSEKCQLGRWTNKKWGAQAQTHQQDVLAQWFVDITDFFPDTTVFAIRKLASRNNEIKYRYLLTNQIVLYTRLTYVKTYQNILERFWTNLNLWRSMATEPIIFTYDEKARHLVHQDSTY